jgi:putative flippase GtrA
MIFEEIVGKTWRYALVGVSVSILYSLIVVALVGGLGAARPTYASVLAFLAVSPVSYVMQARFAFRDAARDQSQPFRFAVMATSSFAAATAAMYLVTETLAWSYLVGIFINWIVIPAVNLFINLVWVFRPHPRSSELGRLPAPAQTQRS